MTNRRDVILLLLASAAQLWLPVPRARAQGRSTPENPTREEILRQAERCRRLLDATVVAFYLPHAVDAEHGGYIENLGPDGRFRAGDDKFLTLQARQLWFFSTLAAQGSHHAAALAAARSGYEFLREHFHDGRHSGYYSKVSAAGNPVDPRKHAYLNSFALYGLVAYYEATDDAAVLAEARELCLVLDKHAYDAAHGGYQEFFHEDWRPVTDPGASGYVGAIGTKTYNTHLHLLESFTALYRAWPDPRVAARLAELIHINTATVKHPDFACNIDGWHRDWTMVESERNLRASYGHDVECAWLVLDAARALGWSEDLLRSWAESTCGYSLRHGYDAEHGGFYYTGKLGERADDRRKEWWVQAEALVSMLEMYRLTGDLQYYRVFAETLDFVEQHQVAEAGGWWATRRADGSPHDNTSRTSMWQGAYHNGRALIRCAKRLEQLAGEETN
jgi:mannobiose 2-epimerase